MLYIMLVLEVIFIIMSFGVLGGLSSGGEEYSLS